MRRSTRSFVTLVILFFLISTLGGSASAAPPTRAKWTVMVYISGDNDLESYVIPDIETELGAVGIETRTSRLSRWRPRARLRLQPRRLADDQVIPRPQGC